MSFLEELVKNGTLTGNQIIDIKNLANEKFGGDAEAALLESGVSEDQIVNAKGVYYNMPTKKLSVKDISFDVLKFIPEDSAQYYRFAPFDMKDGVLEVGILDPENIQGLDALQFISAKIGMPFKLYLISKSDYDEVMQSYKGLSVQVGQALDQMGDDTKKIAPKHDDAPEIALSKEIKEIKKEIANSTDKKSPGGPEAKIVEDAPIIKIVAVVLRNAIEGNASDVHIENIGERVKVRYRVDGVLHTTIMLPASVHAGIVARIKILAKLHLDEKRRPQDGSFSTVVDGRRIDFRVSTMPGYFGEKVAIRILDTVKGFKALEQIGLKDEHVKTIRDAIKKPFGLILVTGPTGAGKTTTLYSMMNELDKERSNIVTLEDPVEYEMPDINQSQVMPEIGYTFASGLRSILRQDPDIIIVGEIRDKETAQLAIQAALTGHLVISTLHTNNAVGAIPRLIDMGVDPYLIAPTLILSVAQRLAKIACPSARKPVKMSESTRLQIEEQLKDLPEEYRSKFPIKEDVFEVVPSSDCPSGTRGRIGVFEMFRVDKDLETLILKSPDYGEIYNLVRSKGMLTMREDAILKAMDGLIPFTEIYHFSSDSE